MVEERKIYTSIYLHYYIGRDAEQRQHIDNIGKVHS